MTGALIGRLVLLAGVLGFILAPDSFVPLLRPFAPDGMPVIYDRAGFGNLTLWHLGLVVAAIVPSALLAILLAVLVTRPRGAEFLPLSRALVGFGQTFPPVAVLALAVPVVGFGAWPTLIALFLYGLLPIFENALAGLVGVPASVALAADGMGMTPRQKLWQVELPLALPLVVEGIRISAVIAISTAAIGSTVAARSLGEVIIAGLNANNLSFVVQGGLLTAGLAVLVYDGLGLVVAAIRRRPR
ncbi:ABC transporter permease [uncultured Paracoccus sp.]|uniref:ABC transporter permease n=1 Tax=uncultured Paracoccus sp. TaxID=189685 RepID=UPI00260B4DCD|nr:ABC transporter permease [uncultured Paracoccus sp.]